MEKEYWSEVLLMKYKFKKNYMGDRILVFEDGVNYRMDEIDKIKGKGEEELKKIHNVKSVFKGVIVE